MVNSKIEEISTINGNTQAQVSTVNGTAHTQKLELLSTTTNERAVFYGMSTINNVYISTIEGLYKAQTIQKAALPK